MARKLSSVDRFTKQFQGIPGSTVEAIARAKTPGEVKIFLNKPNVADSTASAYSRLAKQYLKALGGTNKRELDRIAKNTGVQIKAGDARGNLFRANPDRLKGGGTPVKPPTPIESGEEEEEEERDYGDEEEEEEEEEEHGPPGGTGVWRQQRSKLKGWTTFITFWPQVTGSLQAEVRSCVNQFRSLLFRFRHYSYYRLFVFLLMSDGTIQVISTRTNRVGFPGPGENLLLGIQSGDVDTGFGPGDREKSSNGGTYPGAPVIIGIDHCELYLR